MVLTADQQRVKALLTETITLLCKNGLHFKTKFCIEGLIGITLDGDDVFLVSINETVRAHFEKTGPTDQNLTQSSSVEEPLTTRRIGRKRRKSSSTPDQLLQVRSDPQDLTNSHLEDAAKWQGASALAGLECPSAVKLEMSKSGSVQLQNNDLMSGELDVSVGKVEDANSLRILDVQGNQAGWNEVIRNLEIPLSSDEDSQLKVQEIPGPANKTPFGNDTLVNSEARNKHIQNKASAVNTDTEERGHANNEVIHIKEETASDEELSRSENLFAGYLNFYGLDGNQGYGTPPTSFERLPTQTAEALLPGCSTWNRRHSNRRPASPNPQQQQVELVPGTGIYISYTTHLLFEQDQMMKGSKLVRRLVHELFPDERVLATSSCLGKRQGASHTGLDQQKVDAIKAFVQHRLPHMSHSKIVLAINECCRDARTKLRRLIYREWSARSASMH